MLLTGLSSLLSNGCLNGSAVCKNYGHKSVLVCRVSCNCRISYGVCKSLEFSILGNEVGFTAEAHEDSLLSVDACEHCTFSGFPVCAFCCNKFAFFADDFLCAIVVAFSLDESLLAVHHTCSCHLTQFHYVSCFDFHCVSEFIR